MSARPPRPAAGNYAGTVAGLVAFVGLMGVVPLLLQRRHMRLQAGVPLAQTHSVSSRATVLRRRRPVAVSPPHVHR